MGLSSTLEKPTVVENEEEEVGYAKEIGRKNDGRERVGFGGSELWGVRGWGSGTTGGWGGAEAVSAGAWKAVRAAVGSYRGAQGGRPGSGTALVDTQLDMHPPLLSFST